MGFIRDKVEDVQVEVDGFIDKTRSEVDAMKALFEGFGPEFIATIKALRPRIEASKDEVLDQLDSITDEIKKFVE